MRGGLAKAKLGLGVIGEGVGDVAHLAPAAAAVRRPAALRDGAASEPEVTLF